MSRLIGPDESTRLVYLVRSDTVMQAYRLSPVTIYADEALTALADILTYPGGVAVPGSVLTTDQFGMLPDFYLPDGAEVVWVKVPGGPVWPVYASTPPRIDALRTAFAPVFNVDAYGTFTSPDTTVAAIQAAMDACSAAGGGITYLPSRTYQISATIRPRDNVILQGAGVSTVIQPTFNGHAITSSTGLNLSSFQVRDLKILGPVTNTPATPTRARTTSGPGCDVGIWIDGDLDTATPGSGVITDIEVHNVTVQNTTWLPIRLFGIRGTVKVTECTFINCMDVGFGFNYEVIVSNNHSRDSADNGFSISRGNRKVTCTGNTVENAAFHGIWLSGFLSSAGPEDFACTGNTVRGCGQNGIMLMDAPTYGTITGNMIDKMGYRGPSDAPEDTNCCGIYVQGDSSSQSAPTRFSKGLAISGNTIRNAPRCAILLDGAQSVRVGENLCIDFGSQFLADGTTVITSSYTSTNVGIILQFPNTVTNCVFYSNEFVDTRSPNYGNWPIFPAASVTNTAFNNRATNLRNKSTLSVPLRGSGLRFRVNAEETMSRLDAVNFTILMSSGVLRWAVFTAQRNRTITQLSLSTGNTAAGATPTLVRYGIWVLNADGSLSGGVFTPNDTALWAGASTNYPKALSSAFTVTEDQDYAIGALCVTAASAATVAGCLAATPADNALTPRVSAVLTGQADLATSYTAGQLAVTQSVIYAAALE